MKKEEEENPLKAARKKTRNDIQARLVKVIKTITTELGQDTLDVEKEAKKLAKKITKKLKISATINTNNTQVTKADIPLQQKAVSKPTVYVKKPVIKAVPSKIIAPHKVKK